MTDGYEGYNAIALSKLYAIEQQHKESDSATRHQARQEQSLPLLQQFKAWLDKTQHGILPKGKLGELRQRSLWPHRCDF